LRAFGADHLRDGRHRQRARRDVTATSQADLALLLLLLSLAVLVGASAYVGATLRPALPTLPDEDCPPPGLSRLLPVGRQVDFECRRGLDALERWMRTHPVRP
jgi:hypothetical protein